MPLAVRGDHPLKGGSHGCNVESRDAVCARCGERCRAQAARRGRSRASPPSRLSDRTSPCPPSARGRRGGGIDCDRERFTQAPARHNPALERRAAMERASPDGVRPAPATHLLRCARCALPELVPPERRRHGRRPRGCPPHRRQRRAGCRRTPLPGPAPPSPARCASHGAARRRAPVTVDPDADPALCEG